MDYNADCQWLPTVIHYYGPGVRAAFLVFRASQHMIGARKREIDDLFAVQAVSPYDEMVAYESIWAIGGMTEKTIAVLFAEGRRPSDVWTDLVADSRDGALEGLKTTVEQYLQTKLGRFSISLHGDYQYPASLRDAEYPIDLFYYKGDLDIVNSPSVSVVGSRDCSEEGAARARRLAKALVERGVTVVSGLAAGIDTAALSSAIAHGGGVIAVIGTPIDEYYPKENQKLQDTIADTRLLISQVPFFRYRNEPFQHRRYYFPRRNVTMAALSQATIIVEASDTSGTLTQARAALKQGRKLFILNSCFEKSSITWPARFEKQGAIRVREIDDIFQHLELK